MAKVFWVVCPECDNRFYASTDDYRHKDHELWCPECEHRFLDKDCKELVE